MDEKIYQVFGWDEIGNEIRVETHRFTDKESARKYLRTLGTENRVIAKGNENILNVWAVIGAITIRSQNILK